MRREKIEKSRGHINQGHLSELLGEGRHMVLSGQRAGQGLGRYVKNAKKARPFLPLSAIYRYVWGEQLRNIPCTGILVPRSFLPSPAQLPRSAHLWMTQGSRASSAGPWNLGGIRSRSA